MVTATAPSPFGRKAMREVGAVTAKPGKGTRRASAANFRITALP
jgi:hypothetical protein